MKRAILIHCWDGYPEYCWYPYAKHELETRGFQVQIPFLPDPLPSLERWLEKMKRIIGMPDEETFFIGHSLGCATILRYVQALPQDQKVGGIVLVVPFVDDMGYRLLNNFFVPALDYREIKKHCASVTVIASDNDPLVQNYHAETLRRHLHAELLIKHDGHFTESKATGVCRELPEVVGAIENMANQIKLTIHHHEKTRVYN